MKKSGYFHFASLAAVLAGAMACSHDNAGYAKGLESQQLQRREYVEGQIQQASQDEVCLQTPGGQSYTLKVDDQTSVLINGREGSASDLQPSDRVQVVYRTANSAEPLAVRVDATTATPRSATSPGDTSSLGRGSASDDTIPQSAPGYQP